MNGNPIASGSGSGIQSVLHSNGFYMLANRTSNKVYVYQIAGSGAATTATAVAGSPFATQGTQTVTVALTSNQKFLIAGNGTSRNLTVFSVDGTSGALTFKSIQPVNTLNSSGESSNGLGYLPPAPFVDYNVTVVTDSPHIVAAGSGTGNLVYTATVTNNGTQNATGLQLTNTQIRPSGVTFTSATPSAGTSFNAGTGIWVVGPLAAGASATLTLTDTVDSTAAAGTRAVVNDSIAVSASDQTAINLGDDSASQSSSITRTIDLNVTVGDAPHSVVAGSGIGNLTYTVTVINKGPVPATGVQVTNTQSRPTGVTLVSGTGSAGTSFNSGNGIWTIPSLAVGASARR